MESTGAQLFTSPHLLSLVAVYVSRHGYAVDVPGQRPSPRIGHGLHHEEIARLWLRGDDAADTDCGAPKVAAHTWQALVQRQFRRSFFASVGADDDYRTYAFGYQ